MKKDPSPIYLNNLASHYYNQKKYDQAEKYLLLAIEKNPNPKYLQKLVIVYDAKKKYNELLVLYKKYNININHIISQILQTNFQLDEISLGILRHYNIHDDASSINYIFSEQDLDTLVVVRKIGIVPKTNSVKQYDSYKLFTDSNFHKQLQLRIRLRIPKNIFVCICKKIFGNDI